MNPRSGLRLGVDIGGTKIAAGVVDATGRVLQRYRTGTPRTGSGSDVMTAIVELVAAVRTDHDISAIGLGAKGVIDAERGVVLQDGETLPGWGGTDVAGPLRDATGLPIAVDNDVRVTALGEALHGAGTDIDRLLVAAVGTGVGGGLVVGGQLVRGGHGTTGEIAHLLVPGRGAIGCGCGRYDHLEAVVAGPAIAAEFARRAGVPVPTLPEVVTRMHDGDAEARQVIADAGRVLGAALAGLASAVDVDGVVVGGGVAGIGEPFLGAATVTFGEHVLEPLRGIPFRSGALGPDAPIIGAAELAERFVTV